MGQIHRQKHTVQVKSKYEQQQEELQKQEKSAEEQDEVDANRVIVVLSFARHKPPIRIATHITARDGHTGASVKRSEDATVKEPAKAQPTANGIHASTSKEAVASEVDKETDASSKDKADTKHASERKKKRIPANMVVSVEAHLEAFARSNPPKSLPTTAPNCIFMLVESVCRLSTEEGVSESASSQRNITSHCKFPLACARA